MAKELIPSDPSQRTFAFKREATGMNCFDILNHSDLNLVDK